MIRKYIQIKIKVLEYEYITNYSYVYNIWVIYYYVCKNKNIIKLIV